MTLTQRNETFLEYQRLIGITVYHHRSLMEAMKMDADDMKQELAVCLLKAIENYDPTRGTKQSTFYFKMLRYGVLKLWREQLRQKRLANISASPLVSVAEDGETVELDLPIGVDYDMNVRIGEFMRTLSVKEQGALARTVGGFESADKRHKRFMDNVRRKALRYRLTGYAGNGGGVA